KSNWAQPLDTPPYVGYAVTTGITFTFGGLKITERGEVIDCEQRPIPGLFAAGELVGGLFYHNYPGGAGLMAGAVFGRIAGRSAARPAQAERPDQDVANSARRRASSRRGGDSAARRSTTRRGPATREALVTASANAAISRLT